MNSERRSIPLLFAGILLTLTGCLLLWRVLPGYVNNLAAQRTTDAAMLPNQVQAIAPSEIPLTPAPSFVLNDCQGQSYRLEDFAGQPVAMLFWINPGEPLQAGIPEFIAAAAQRDDARFVAVLIDGNVENGDEIMEQIGIEFNLPLLMDAERTAAQAFGVRAAPTTVFLDAAGNIGGMVEGRLNADALNTGIDVLLVEQ